MAKNNKKSPNLMILEDFEEVLRIAAKTLNYRSIFKWSGITNILEQYFINVEDLSKDYINILYQAIENFLDNPLFRDLKLNDEKSLKSLNGNDEFDNHIEATLSKMKKELVPRHSKVIDKLDTIQSEEEELSFKDLQKSTNLDKVSLLLILSTLKEQGLVHNFDDREISVNR